MLQPPFSIQKTATFAWSPNFVNGSPFYLVAGSVAGALDANFSSVSELELYNLPFASTPSSSNMIPTITSTKTNPSPPSSAVTTSDPLSQFTHLTTSPKSSPFPPTFSSSSSVTDSSSFFANLTSDTSSSMLATQEQHGSIEKIASITCSARFHRLAWSHFHSETHPLGLIAGGFETGELKLYQAHQLTMDPVFQSQPYTTGIRGLAFNPLQHHLLGTAAGSGDQSILIWDLNHLATPYAPSAGSTSSTHKPSMGSDVVQFAWNPCVHPILATTNTQGVTVVWDLKHRREVFTLPPPATSMSNAGMMGATSTRRSGVVVAWHPDMPTQFLTAMEDDTNPLIYMWDLRNAHAPLKAMAGHSQGILSVDWCTKDSELLLSCGKDRRTLCWNTTTGEVLGELPHADNWCFEVQWCPQHPNTIAVASFDAHLHFHSLVTSSSVTPSPIALKKPPKWFRRPCSVSFDFQGRIVWIQGTLVKRRCIGGEIMTLSKEWQASLQSREVAVFLQQRADREVDPARKLTWITLKALFLGDEGRSLVIQALQKEVMTCKVPSTHASGMNMIIPPPLIHSPSPPPPPPSSSSSMSVSSSPSKSQAPPSSVAATTTTTTTTIEEALLGSSESKHENEKPASPTPDLTEPTTKDTTMTPSSQLTPSSMAPLGYQSSMLSFIVHGEYEKAVDEALRYHQFSDAFLFASCGSTELFTKTRDQYLTSMMQSHSNLLHRLMDMITHQHFDHLNQLDLTWGQMLILLLVYSQGDMFTNYTRTLGDVLEQHHIELGAIVCYLLSGHVEALVTIWSRHLQDQIIASPIQQNTQRWGPKFDEASRLLHQFIEMSTLVMTAIGNPMNNNDSETSPLPGPLKSKYLEYSELLALNGQLSVAWEYLQSISTSESTTLPNVKLAFLKDRVYHALTKKEQASIPSPPSCPFSTIVVPVPTSAGNTMMGGHPQATGLDPMTSKPAMASMPMQPTNSTTTPNYLAYAPNTYKPLPSHPPSTSSTSSSMSAPSYQGYPSSNQPNFAPPPPPPAVSSAPTSSSNPMGNYATGYPSYLPPNAPMSNMAQPTSQTAPPPPASSSSATHTMPPSPYMHLQPAPTGYYSQSSSSQPPLGPPPPPPLANTNAGVPPSSFSSTSSYIPNAYGPPKPMNPSYPSAHSFVPPPSGYPSSMTASAAAAAPPPPPPPPSSSSSMNPITSPSSMSAPPPPPSSSTMQFNYLPPPPPLAAGPTPPTSSSAMGMTLSPTTSAPPLPSSSLPSSSATTSAWNDAPSIVPLMKKPSVTPMAPLPAFTSPFPNATPPPPSTMHPSATSYPPPPSSSSTTTTNAPMMQAGPVPIYSAPPPPPPNSSTVPGATPVPPVTSYPSSSYSPSSTVQPPPSSLQQQQQQQPQQHQQGPPSNAPPTNQVIVGDRSKIPSTYLPIYQILSQFLTTLPSQTAPSQKRLLDDIEKRVNMMLDQLNAGTLHPELLQSLLHYVQALQNKDYNLAYKLHQDMATRFFDPWMIGLKRLLDVIPK